MADYIVRAMAGNAQIRAFAATTRETVETARVAHNLSPVASAALGRTLTGAAMMGAMLKGEKDLLTLQIKGDGPIGGITATADSKGNVKGYVGNPSLVIPPNYAGKLDVGAAVGYGMVQVMKDMGLKEPYCGQTVIQTGEIAQDIAYYYALSEQVPTVCALGVLMNKDNTVRESGGYIIQLMPDCPEETISKLEEKLKDIPSVTDLLRNGETPESILKRILGDMDLHIFENMPVAFRCNCSRERVTAALIALGRKELSNIIADGKPETLNCAFCNTDYVFTVDEMKEILTKCTH